MSDELQREIGRLEAKLTSARVIDELSTVRRDLASGGDRRPSFQLANVRVASPCKERWADMVGDDRVRACSGCDRPVFNLSEMTRAQAEAVLATRGVTPCVRFYRRTDGTVMTADCPTGTRRESRRLAVVASTFGTALAGTSPAMAEPAPAPADAAPADAAPADAATTPDATDPTPDAASDPTPVRDDRAYLEVMGIMDVEPRRSRPPLEWSIWTRLGVGVASHAPSVVARSTTPPMPDSSVAWEAAVAAELSVPVARNGDVRLGAWAELRTSSGPLIGGELIVQGLPPRPHVGTFDGTGGIVVRVGGNAHVLTTAVGFGYTGAWSRRDPWISFARHVVGVRLVTSMNRSLDDPRDWSVTAGLEFEPIGALAHVLGFGPEDEGDRMAGGGLHRSGGRRLPTLAHAGR